MTEPPPPTQPAWDVLNGTIKIPIICPVCKAEARIELNAVQTRNALIQERPIYLHSFCHSACWNASEAELEQIRDYLHAARTPDTPT